MHQRISLVVVLSVTSVANAQLPKKPQTPSPMPLIREAFMPKDEVLLSYPFDFISEGKTIWLWRYHKKKLNELVITNVQGDKLTDQEIRKALAKPTMVLVSVDGNPIHQYYLTVFKPETLVIIDKMPVRVPAGNRVDE